MFHYYTYIIGLLLIASSCAPPRNNAVNVRRNTTEDIEMSSTAPTEIRRQVTEYALSLVGIKEHGSNRGKGVEEILANANLPPGTAYCGATVMYVYDHVGVHYTMDARARSCCPPGIKTKHPQPGDVVGMWWSGNVVQHVGIYLGRQDEFVLTVEGNTSNPNDKREEGVYRKSRSVDNTPMIYGNQIDP